MTTITAAMAAPAIFSALISTFQTAQAASISATPSAAQPLSKLIPETGSCSKPAKNNPGLLQSYVTYGTLPRD